MSSYQKRKKPNYYNAQKAKKKREFVLKPGLKGFLCTCNNREKDCIRESYNILNEYADILYGEEKPGATATSAPAEGASANPDAKEEGSEDEDIEAALNKELDSLKAERSKLPSMRRFQVVESGANNCIFIQTTVPEPVELVHHIMKDLEATKKQKTRFLLRLLPIEATCKAYLEDIRQTADALFDKYFTKEGKTFAILFNRRNSSGVNRDDLIRDLAQMVIMRNPENKADLKHPQFAILVEVIRNMCCLSVLPDYFDLRKYNLLELCSPEGGIKLVDGKGEEIETGRKSKNEETSDKNDDKSSETEGTETDGKGDVETAASETEEGKEVKEGGDAESSKDKDNKEPTEQVENKSIETSIKDAEVKE